MAQRHAALFGAPTDGRPSIACACGTWASALIEDTYTLADAEKDWKAHVFDADKALGITIDKFAVDTELSVSAFDYALSILRFRLASPDKYTLVVSPKYEGIAHRLRSEVAVPFDVIVLPWVRDRWALCIPDHAVVWSGWGGNVETPNSGDA